jgi:ABC-type sugar transport system permease subunit
MARSVFAGLAYFAAVFAAGFALGVLRVTLAVPTLGEPAAVALELPLMLAISWMACGWSIARFALPSAIAAGAVMGGVAFAMLMAAEAGISVWIAGRTLADHFARYRGAAGLLGLAGQAAFALFPAVRLFPSTARH